MAIRRFARGGGIAPGIVINCQSRKAPVYQHASTGTVTKQRKHFAMMTYRLTPIDLDHESWKRSKVKQTVRVLAQNCTDARSKAMQATMLFEYRPAPNLPHISPWKLIDVTSCEPDASAVPPPPDQVVSEDGTHWPVRL